MHWDAATARTPLTTSPQKQKRKKKQPKNQVNLALSPSLSLSLCVALVAHSHSMEESSSSSSPWPMHARQVSQERRLSASQLRCGGVSHTRVLHAVLSRGGAGGSPSCLRRCYRTANLYHSRYAARLQVTSIFIHEDDLLQHEKTNSD